MTHPIAYATPDRRAALRAMSYSEYLRTPEWQQVRHYALHRDGFSCVLCAATDSLQVHHRRYTRRSQEHGSDVVTLCSVCHSRHHAAVGGSAAAGIVDAARDAVRAVVAITGMPHDVAAEVARAAAALLERGVPDFPHLAASAEACRAAGAALTAKCAANRSTEAEVAR